MRKLPLAVIVSLLVLQPTVRQSKGFGQAADQKAEATSPELVEAAKLSQEAARLYDVGRYDEALPIAKRSLGIREKALGPDHELVAGSLNSVARIYLAIGKSSDAASLYKRSLTILERKFGTASINLTYALEQLALTRFVQRNYGDGEKLYLRALAITEKTFGPEHLETARSLTVLGRAYERSNKPARALDYYKRSLAIEEKALGPDYPGLAESLDHCACALILNDQPDEAKQYRERANKIRNFAVVETLRQPHGVLQGAAILRVEPEYPLAARQAGVRGSVIVQATVDECGKVINAFAISGPAELKPAAEKAARGWRFTPTRLAGRPVKVIGTITFNFNL